MLLSLFLRLNTYYHGISYYHTGIWGKGDGKLHIHDEPQSRKIHECVTLTLMDKTDRGAQWLLWSGGEKYTFDIVTANAAFFDRREGKSQSSSCCTDQRRINSRA